MCACPLGPTASNALLSVQKHCPAVPRSRFSSHVCCNCRTCHNCRYCSGSTALLCHIGPRSITTAWVGDSRAVLGRRKHLVHHQGPIQQRQQRLEQLRGPAGSSSSSSMLSEQQQQQQSAWEAIPLSFDHKPDRQDENVSAFVALAVWLSLQFVLWL